MSLHHLHARLRRLEQQAQDIAEAHGEGLASLLTARQRDPGDDVNLDAALETEPPPRATGPVLRVVALGRAPYTSHGAPSMSRSLARRLRMLEVRWEDMLLATWNGLPTWEQRAVLNECTLLLIRQGLLPAPDPKRPDACIDELRRTAGDVLQAWHEASVGNPAWRQRRPAGLDEFIRLARQRVVRRTLVRKG